MYQLIQRICRPVAAGLASLAFTAFASAAGAQTAPAQAEVAVAQPGSASPTADLERRVDALAADIEQLKLGDAAAPVALESKYGLGPAASKVYRQTSGLSVGGYGEMLYRNVQEQPRQDVLDFLRNVLYFGYKFDDRWVLNTEIEFEHVTEVYVEFGYIDYLWRPELNIRAGMMLVPMGLVGEMHEPTTVLTATRPETETAILPSTWRENGVGLFGDVGPLTYRAYLLNGMNAAGFSAAGLRAGRQKGANAKAEDFAGVLRLDYTGTPGLLVGGSVYYGGADQDQLGTVEINNLIYEGHLDLKWRGLEIRGLFAQARTDGAAELNKARALTDAKGVAEVMQGYYAQIGFDVLAPFDFQDQSLTPVLRYERVNTHAQVVAGFKADPKQDRSAVAVGLAFAPMSQVVLKGEYQMRDNAAEADGDKPGDQWFLQLGYIF